MKNHDVADSFFPMRMRARLVPAHWPRGLTNCGKLGIVESMSDWPFDPEHAAHKKEDSAAAFLAAYRECDNIRTAAKAAGINRETVRRWIASDPVFAAAFEDARQDAIDAMEQIGRDRALATSDTLMIFLLKAGRPDKYRERSDQNVNLSGSVEVLKRVGADLERLGPVETKALPEVDDEPSR